MPHRPPADALLAALANAKGCALGSRSDREPSGREESDREPSGREESDREPSGREDSDREPSGREESDREPFRPRGLQIR